MRIYPAFVKPKAVTGLPLCPAIAVRLLPAAFVMLFELFVANPAAVATGVVFAGLQVTIATGLNTPSGTVVDAGGNVYVADVYNSRILKFPRISAGLNCDAAAACTVVGSGFTRPIAVAVDSSGNVYVLDAATQSLSEITPEGAQTVVATGLANGSGVTVASSGTLYVPVPGAVMRVAAGAASVFASGPAQPGGIAADANANIYLADIANNLVLRFTSSGAQTTVATGLNAPQAVALDATGNLYIADTGNNRIVSVPAISTGLVCPANCTISTAQVSVPGGVSADPNGSLYIADTGNNQLVKLAQDADFGTFPVTVSNATPQTSLTLNYLLYSSSCAAPPTVAVLLHGVTGKDFTYNAANNVCTPGPHDSLAITVNFAPLFPGLRTGAVQFTDATGAAQVATYLHGTGNGPQITWTPGVANTVLANPGASSP